MKKAAEYFVFGLIILLMTVAMLTFLAPYFGWRVDALVSGSMEPQLKVGGLVVTRPMETKDIKVEDIITFYSPLDQELTSHRVIAAKEDSSLYFQTKGDANKDADPFVVPAQNVVGKVCFYLPYFGYFTQFVKTTFGFMLTLCLPGLIIIGIEIEKLWRVLTEEGLRRKQGVG